MYWLYSRETSDGNTTYKKLRSTKLFGSRKGIVAELLRSKILPQQDEPYEWNVDVRKDFAKTGRPNYSLVIDVKPKNKSPELLFHELLDVWGYSANDWTPILLRLKEIVREKM
jgi:hypothetical protein